MFYYFLCTAGVSGTILSKVVLADISAFFKLQSFNYYYYISDVFFWGWFYQVEEVHFFKADKLRFLVGV